MSSDAGLLILYADGEASPGELVRAEELLLSSAAARAELAGLLRQRLMLAQFLAAEAAAPAGPEPVLILSDSGRTPSPRPWWRRRGALVAAPGAAAVAAAVLLAALLSGPARRTGPAPGPEQAPDPAGYVITGAPAAAEGLAMKYGGTLELPAGERGVEMLLADRSILGVLPGSRVSFSAPRSIELEHGEVRLVCKQDPERRFVVRAGASTVTALGTEFTVENRRAPGVPGGGPGSGDVEDAEMTGLVRVTVLSGAVLLASQFGELRLSAGEGGEVRGEGRPEKFEPGGKGEGRGDGGERGQGAGHGLQDGDLAKLGEFVQEKVAAGLRGEELAAAIRARIEELKAARDAAKEARKDDKGDKERGPRDGEGGPKRGPRDGEGEGKARGPREGDGRAKHAPRDGEGGPKRGPKELPGLRKPGPEAGMGVPKRGGPREVPDGRKRGPREGDAEGGDAGDVEIEGEIEAGEGPDRDGGRAKARRKDRGRAPAGDGFMGGGQDVF